jgi:hypothetical protein
MGAKIFCGCNHKINHIEGICPDCGTPNPVFRKAIAAAKNRVALTPRNMYELIVVILTLLGVYGVCGAVKAIF